MSRAYCTIAARNYLPQAMTLLGSLNQHEPDAVLYVLVVDDGPIELPDSAQLRILRNDSLGLPRRDFLQLATIYGVVELSTSLKPLLLQLLLEEYDEAVYLDPDTFVCSPLLELAELLAEHSLILTPHFLRPIEPGSAYVSEVHSLTVGAYNLGFCAVSREAKEFLAWWRERLQFDCLIYPLLGIFVDQKWADVGSVLYPSFALRHPGYNVGPWNLHERLLVARRRILDTGWVTCLCGCFISAASTLTILSRSARV